MNIAFFNSNKAWGGGEKWHLQTALDLIKRNYNVYIFAEKNNELFNRSLNENLTVFGCHITNLSFLNFIKMIRFIRLFKKLHINVIILNLSSDVKFAGIAAKLAGVKKIIYRRGLPVPVKNNAFNKFIFKNILTHIIANSQTIKLKILENNSNLISSDKIFVIYNCVENKITSINRPNNIFTETKGIILGSAGRLSAEKRQNCLIEMAGMLKEKGTIFTLIVAGTGELWKSLKYKTKEMDLDDRIIFTGFVNNMDDFYNKLDIFILTSSWEGCSNAVLEAMQWKKPVIAFDNSSFHELIINGETGFLVKDGDINDLAEKTALLINNTDLREKFGTASHRLIETKFSREKSISQLEDLIKL